MAAKDNTVALVILVLLAGAGAGTAAKHGVGVSGPHKAPTQHTNTVCTKYFKGGCP